jgi:hypothetical protein
MGRDELHYRRTSRLSCAWFHRPIWCLPATIHMNHGDIRLDYAIVSVA